MKINIISKRTDAPIVFGIMHRNYNHRYQFIATSFEKMKKQFIHSTDIPTGEVLLKHLEQYIYKHPEGWYQWKQYPTIITTQYPVTPAEKTSYLPLLKPSLG
ncbi:MAG: hypothetical protein U9Q38_06780 [Thermodesulfobacteriota bacterium]|nr:hypothetical protein [Thermodesulfobacteriota bacterium]